MKPENQYKLIGHNTIFDELVSFYDNGILPSKILLSGKKGIGKCTLGYHLINYIFSKDEENKYDFANKKINVNNNSYKLIQNSIHANFYKISLQDAKKSIDIEQIRNMINFTQKSSFNNKEKIILIDQAEYLNQSSNNALLKVLEEKNLNIIFILILNNEKKILKTIKSRFIDFKINLEKKFVNEIVNNYFEKDIFDSINSEFKVHYFAPSFYIDFVSLCNEIDFDYQKLDINDFLQYFISEKIYNKKLNNKYDFKLFFELYFKKRILKIYNTEIVNYYNYFNKKYFEINKYNLDVEPFFIEFNSKILNGK